MATEYGTIAVVPKGEWDSGTEYEVANLVTLDGSSYIAHTKPPAGTLPTDTAYWQISAQGTSKATADSVGTIKPDGATTEVDSDGTLSVKAATQSTLGLVKGSSGITVGEDGTVDVNTTFQQATELANIIAGEAIAQVLGKVSKSIAVTMGLEQNALLKNMLTNVDTDDTGKVPSAALLHSIQQSLQEQILDRIPFSHLINNGLTTEEGFALDARYGKTLADWIAQLNGNKTPFYTYDAKIGTEIDQAIKEGLLSAGQTRVFILRVHIPEVAVFVFLCGYNSNTYTAMGFMIGQKTAILHSIWYKPNEEFQRYTLYKPSEN